jgi:hypothetical protein
MASPKHAIPVSPILGANENLQADLVRVVLSGYDATAAQGARLAVLHARNAASSLSFAQDLTGLLTNSRLSIHDGTNWGRLRGGIDNAVAVGNLRGAYVGGIVTDPVGVFVNGDVSLLHFDLNGRLLTLATLAGGVGPFAQGDFDSIAGNEATATALWVRSAVTGLDATLVAGARNVPIAARGAVAAQAYTLERLLVDGVVRGDDSATYSAIAARAAVAAQAYTVVRLCTDSILRADDGATYSSLTARAAGAAHSEALMHLLSSSCVYGYDASLGVGVRDVPIGTDLASAISGRLATAFRGLNTDSLTCGIDNTVAAPNNVIRPVEVRPLVTATDISGLYGLVTLGMQYVRDETSGTVVRVGGDVASAVSGVTASARRGPYSMAVNVGIDNTAVAVLRPVEIEGATSASASARESWYSLGVLQSRESGFAAARRGKRFYTTNPVAGTPLTCQTAYVATTPSLMIRVNSANIRAIIRSLSFTIANTPGALVGVMLKLDTTDRYSAAGTQLTPANTNEESATAAVAQVWENPTAAAEGGTQRVLVQDLVSNVAGTKWQLKVEDSVLLGITAATLLLYVWSATTAPQIYHQEDHEEVS